MIAAALEETVYAYPGRDDPALDRASMEVERGKFFGLLGPNGAGKTTLIELLCGLLRPDSGSVRILGADPGNRSTRTAVGFCPQDLALFRTLTARENLGVFGRLAGLRGPGLAARVDSALRSVGLVEQADRRVETFSGGMKRRLNLAVAILHDPDLLLLDEPTVGVDPQSRNRIFETLQSLHAAGKTILYTTHYMEEAERLCSRLAIIDRGKIIASGPTAELSGGGEPARIVLDLDDDVPEGLTAELARNGQEAETRGGRRLEIPDRGDPALLETVSRVARSHGRRVVRYDTRRPNLEDTFLRLTGRSLRD